MGNLKAHQTSIWKKLFVTLYFLRFHNISNNYTFHFKSLQFGKTIADMNQVAMFMSLIIAKWSQGHKLLKLCKKKSTITLRNHKSLHYIVLITGEIDYKRKLLVAKWETNIMITFCSKSELLGYNSTNWTGKNLVEFVNTTWSESFAKIVLLLPRFLKFYTNCARFVKGLLQILNSVGWITQKYDKLKITHPCIDLYNITDRGNKINYIKVQ